MAKPELIRPCARQIQEAADITAGGVVLPITAREKPVAGTVVRTGPGKRSEDGTERKAPQVPAQRQLCSVYGVLAACYVMAAEKTAASALASRGHAPLRMLAYMLADHRPPDRLRVCGQVKEGDNILYFKWAGDQMETPEGDKFVVLRESDILCKT